MPAGIIEGDGFSLAEVTYPAGAVFESHSHDRTYVALALCGRFDEHVGGRVSIVQSASVVIMPAGVTHADHIARGGHRALVVTFQERAFDPSHWRVLQGGTATRLLLRVYRAFRMSGAAEVGTMEELLIGMREALLPRDTLRPTRAVDAASKVIRDNYTLRISFLDVARQVGVDRSYLARAFRSCYGETMGETLRRLRATHAAALLASTTRPISEVALSSGFADQSHLCRVFRYQMGVTPLAYRRLVRG